MATKHNNDDFDLPDQHVEPDPPPPQVVVIAEDLKLGSAEVKPYDRNAWIREFGPKPPSAGMRVVDFVILGLFAGTVLVIIKACAWAYFS
jgi:hypothetical protein